MTLYSTVEFKIGRLSRQASPNLISPLKAENFLQLVTEEKIKN